METVSSSIASKPESDIPNKSEQPVTAETSLAYTPRDNTSEASNTATAPKGNSVEVKKDVSNEVATAEKSKSVVETYQPDTNYVVSPVKAHDSVVEEKLPGNYQAEKSVELKETQNPKQIDVNSETVQVQPKLQTTTLPGETPDKKEQQQVPKKQHNRTPRKFQSHLSPITPGKSHSSNASTPRQDLASGKPPRPKTLPTINQTSQSTGRKARLAARNYTRQPNPVKTKDRDVNIMISPVTDRNFEPDRFEPPSRRKPSPRACSVGLQYTNTYISTILPSALMEPLSENFPISPILPVVDSFQTTVWDSMRMQRRSASAGSSNRIQFVGSLPEDDTTTFSVFGTPLLQNEC